MRSIKDFNLNKIISEKQYFQSPSAWEDQILYFLLVDRFSNGYEKDINLYNKENDYENAFKSEKSKSTWTEAGDKWNGGTLHGIKSKIKYLKDLGITAIWISPIFKQVAFEDSYHGYGIQNFLEIDPHFGNRDDLVHLVEEAHAQGIYVILDIILNHCGNIFDYQMTDPIYNDGAVFPVEGLKNSKGEAIISVEDINIKTLSMDDGILPIELLNKETFLRKGRIVNWDNYPEYMEGDFMSLKKINTGEGDYDCFYPSEALRTITECFKYWIAFADIDGFRLDTVKHLNPGATRFFVSQINEFALTLQKNNFYIIGEITGGMNFAIDTLKKTGLHAALGINKIPEKLEQTAKGYINHSEFFNLFKNSQLLGEDEYKWYKNNVVTMFDDHDMVVQGTYKNRFCADKFTDKLLLNGLFINLMSPGIPCIYYGTEQEFDGSGEADKYIRETMFESDFGAFRTHNKHFFNATNPVFMELKKMIQVRKDTLALREGRIYLRELSYDGKTFELPNKVGEDRFTGIIAWSRIISQDEIVLLVNCNLETSLSVHVVIDSEIHKKGETFECIYSSDMKAILSKSKITKKGKLNTLNLTVPPFGSVAYQKNKVIT